MPDQRLRQAYALAHPLGIGADPPFCRRPQIDPLQQRHCARRIFALEAHVSADRLQPGQRGMERHVLRQIGHVLPRHARSGGRAADRNLARIRRDEA